jgi:uncharacterized membrane protein
VPEEDSYELVPGQPAPQSKDPQAPGFVAPEPIVEKAVDAEAEAARTDAEANRVAAMLAYLPGLFLVTLLFAHKSPFARYHANQGLLVFFYFLFTWLVIGLAWIPSQLSGMLPNAGMPLAILSIIGCFGDTLAVVGLIGLIVAGLVYASNGERRPLPVIGNIELIKADV